MKWSRDSFARIACLVCALSVGLGCDSGGDDGGAGMTAGASGTGTGGTGPGSGGTAPGTGGTAGGTGGTAAGTGGAGTGTGGTGGSPSGTGGSGGAMCSECVRLPLSWGMVGGLVAHTEQSALATCGRYGHMRTATSGEPGPLCESELPCEGSGVVTAGQIQAVVDREEVQAAVENETLFGVDNRPADGQIFEVRVGYQAVHVGEPCAGEPSCVAISPGVQMLVDLLQQLDEQELAKPPCQGMFE